MKYIKAGKLNFPTYLEKSYRTTLLNLVKYLEKNISLKILDNLKELSNNNPLNKDDIFDDIERLIHDIKTTTEYKTLNTIQNLLELGNSISKFTLNQIVKSISSKIKIEAKTEGIDIFRSTFNSDIRLLTKSWVYTNTRLIKSIPQNLLDDVAIVIQTNFRAGSSIEVIREEIQKKFKISNNRARLIARDQVAKLNSDIAKNEYKKLGIDLYLWITSGDERVRQSHKVLNNKICTWDNPTVYKNKDDDLKWKMRSSIQAVEKDVGKDFQCRCTPIALIPINNKLIS